MRKKIFTPISEIISLCETSENVLISDITGRELEFLNDNFDSPVPMKFGLHFPKTSVVQIVDSVKNTILEWTLKLESEGIIGENMTFTLKEKTDAHGIPQTINHYYGSTSIVNSPTDKVQVISGNNNKVTFSYDDAKKAADEIEESISSANLSSADNETAIELLTDIRSKIEDKKNPNIIKSALVGLKDFSINAGAGVVGGLIQAKIQGLF